MWYECLPPLMIIGACVSGYQWFSWFLVKSLNGKPYALDLSDVWPRHMAERDCRISGSPWIHKGLENIPDED